ncbi:hypothetical protein FISHEDRAFT_75001 [Fistulina hepatica ATCC 64428]|uniref:Uncharacterized protein n=1 Tax=Fistulina hepatica ATCC 64428 TaxID=1128425 RepID=A0A0D7A8G3_9AGAR|nr:hypothetical protein FISHEDRAFT_75001 [Fistulina hepatica ATCC 64428]
MDNLDKPTSANAKAPEASSNKPGGKVLYLLAVVIPNVAFAVVHVCVSVTDKPAEVVPVVASTAVVASNPATAPQAVDRTYAAAAASAKAKGKERAKATPAGNANGPSKDIDVFMPGLSPALTRLADDEGRPESNRKRCRGDTQEHHAAGPSMGGDALPTQSAASGASMHNNAPQTGNGATNDGPPTGQAATGNPPPAPTHAQPPPAQVPPPQNPQQQAQQQAAGAFGQMAAAMANAQVGVTIGVFMPGSVPLVKLPSFIEVGLEDTTRAAWDAHPGPKAGISIFGGSRRTSAAQVYPRIAADLAARYNIPVDAITIAPPVPAAPGPQHSDPLKPCLIIDTALYPNAFPMLAAMTNHDGGLHNSPEVFYWVEQYHDPHVSSTFLAFIEGGYYRAGEGPVMLAAVKVAFWADPLLQQMVCTHRSNFLATIANDQAFEYFLTTLHVSPLAINTSGSIPTIAWRLYGRYPLMVCSLIDTLRGRIYQLTFRDGFHGASKPVHFGRRCNQCTSHDHPTGLCPFPRMPGWLVGGGNGGNGLMGGQGGPPHGGAPPERRGGPSQGRNTGGMPP